MVCGWQASETRKVCDVSAAGATACNIVIASAAAVASSSSDAFAIGNPVRSAIMRLEVQQRLEPSLARSRPDTACTAVYQPGFSRMFRWITGGVMHVGVAHADERLPDLVLRAQRLQLFQQLRLGHRRRQLQRAVETDLGRHDVIDELVERGHAQQAQHLCDVVGAGADVAGGETVRLR